MGSNDCLTEVDNVVDTDLPVLKDDNWEKFLIADDVPDSLANHKPEHTSGEKVDITSEEKIECEICFKKFRPIYLARHMEVHAERKHDCPYCDKKFKRPYHLKEHVKKIHSQEVRF